MDQIGTTIGSASSVGVGKRLARSVSVAGALVGAVGNWHNSWHSLRSLEERAGPAGAETNEQGCSDDRPHSSHESPAEDPVVTGKRRAEQVAGREIDHGVAWRRQEEVAVGPVVEPGGEHGEGHQRECPGRAEGVPNSVEGGGSEGWMD